MPSQIRNYNSQRASDEAEHPCVTHFSQLHRPDKRNVRRVNSMQRPVSIWLSGHRGRSYLRAFPSPTRSRSAAVLSKFVTVYLCTAAVLSLLSLVANYPRESSVRNATMVPSRAALRFHAKSRICTRPISKGRAASADRLRRFVPLTRTRFSTSDSAVSQTTEDLSRLRQSNARTEGRSQLGLGYQPLVYDETAKK